MSQPRPANAAVCVALAVLCAAAFVFDALLTREMTRQMHMNDFGKFYYATRWFLEGRDMYAPSPATDLRLEKAEGLQFLDMNPPHFHLLVLPLAVLSPDQAVTIWMAASVFALILAVLLIAREIAFEWTLTRLLLVLFGTLAFAGSQAFFATGQLSMFLLLATTLCWLDARQARWSRVGVWLGICLSIKPFFLIFVPYLIGTRRFPAAVLAVATAVAAFALGFVVFGVDAHLSWYRAIGQSADWAWTPMNASTLGFFRRAFGETPYFTPALSVPSLVTFWPLAAGVVGALSLLAATLDRSPLSTDRAFALLLVAAPLVSPLGWVYYLWLPAGPIAVLVRTSFRDTAPAARSSHVLAATAVVALLWPLATLYAFQPHAWATVTIGSIYFWGNISLWGWLLVDYWRSRRLALAA